MSSCVPGGGGVELLVVPSSELLHAARDSSARGTRLAGAAASLAAHLPAGHEFGIACQPSGAKVRAALEDGIAVLGTLDEAWQGISRTIADVVSDAERADMGAEWSFAALLRSTREVSCD